MEKHTRKNHETLLAFDIGIKRTGVAVGQTFSQTAQELVSLPIANGQANWHQVKKLINEWQPNRIIIGQPNSDNQQLKKIINRFKHYFQQHYKLPITEIDERLTTNSANAELATSSLNSNQKQKMRDQVAARLILESYFVEKNVTN